MGQKVNPVGLRLGINRTWDSRWFATRDYADQRHEDLEIRDFLYKRLQQAGVSRVVIERPFFVRIFIRPAVSLLRRRRIEPLEEECEQDTDSSPEQMVLEGDMGSAGENAPNHAAVEQEGDQSKGDGAPIPAQDTDREDEEHHAEGQAACAQMPSGARKQPNSQAGAQVDRR